MERRYTVVCEWQSTHSDCEFDADEIQVVADSAASAIQKAREKWAASIGAEWPHIRLEQAWILSRNARRRGGRVVVFSDGTPTNDSGNPPCRLLRPPAGH
jgi:hypothetical protein